MTTWQAPVPSNAKISESLSSTLANNRSGLPPLLLPHTTHQLAPQMARFPRAVLSARELLTKWQGALVGSLHALPVRRGPTSRWASTQQPALGSPPPITAPAPITITLRSSSRSGSSRLGKISFYSFFLFGSTFLFTYYLDSRSAIHRWIAMPFLHNFLDPEEAQKLAIKLLQSGLAPRDYTFDDGSLKTEVRPYLSTDRPAPPLTLLSRPLPTPSGPPVSHLQLFGMPVVNPIGLAAGFDKQGEAIDGLFDLGFGLVEVGSVTPRPQVSRRPPARRPCGAPHPKSTDLPLSLLRTAWQSAASLLPSS